MPTKNTKVMAVRVPEDIANWVERKAKKKKWTANRWINWAITLGLRSHRRIK